MFNITPIGSCRIYGPLREFGEPLGFRLNAKRIFGLMHSSDEAVQQMHAFKSDFSCEEDLWPLIAKGKDYDHFQREVHEKSDLYIIELSSAKVLKIGHKVLQLNYLNNHFSAFFSDSRRAIAYTQSCMKNDPAGVAAFLEENWSSTPEQRKDNDILKRIEISMSTEQSLYEDICRLQEGLENVMIVTHVNAKNDTSGPLLSRQKYINEVSAAAKRAGAPLYNPTDLMEDVGQKNAIEDHSTAFAHFTGAFNGMIFDDWLDNTLLPMAKKSIQEAPDEKIESLLPAMVDGVQKAGTPAQVEKMEAFLASLIGLYPENARLKQLQEQL